MFDLSLSKSHIVIGLCQISCDGAMVRNTIGIPILSKNQYIGNSYVFIYPNIYPLTYQWIRVASVFPIRPFTKEGLDPNLS